MISQIIPAGNWGAVFDENGEPVLRPLICWGLVKDGGQVQICGYVESEGSVVSASGLSGFLGFELADWSALLAGMLADDDDDDDDDDEPVPEDQIN